MTDATSTAEAEQSAATGRTVAFKPVFEVSPAAEELAAAAGARFQAAIAESSESFRFGPVQAAAKDLPDGSLVKIIPGFGLQEQAPTHVMVLTLKEAVRQALARPLANEAFWERAEEELTAAFVGLGDRLQDPHIVVHPAAEGTSYDYHLLFALEDEETEGFLYVVAFCVHVTVGLDRERALRLSVEDTAPFAIRLDALCVRQPTA